LKILPLIVLDIFYYLDEKVRMSQGGNPGTEGDSRGEAIDIYDQWTPEELKEAYMKYIYKFGIK
jgi:hypothetical protein